MIPLLAILGGIGFSFDSAFAFNVDTKSGCETGIPGAVFSVDQGLNVCTIPEGVDAATAGTLWNDIITISSNGWLVVDGKLTISESGSSIFVKGLIINNGIIENNSQQVMILEGATVANSGTIQNNNMISIYSGSIANIGTFDNLGELRIGPEPGIHESNGIFTNMSPDDGFPFGGQLVNHNNGIIRVGFVSEFNLQDGSYFEDLGTVQIGYDFDAASTPGSEYVYEDTIDADGDGHNSIASGGNDCNDDDPATYLGAPETVIGLDQNCDTKFLLYTITSANGDNFSTTDSARVLYTLNFADKVEFFEPGDVVISGVATNGIENFNIADDELSASFEATALENGNLIVEFLVLGSNSNFRVGGNSIEYSSFEIYVNSPSLENDEFELTAAECEQAAVDEIDIQWTAPILPGYAGTCIVNNEFEGTDSAGETIIVSQDVILLLRNAAGGIAEGAMMQVDGALVLENTVYGNMGLLQVDGYLHIDEDSRFYNIGIFTQSITYQGQTSELTGLGELIVGPNADVLLESELKNSGLIENAGAFEINMCSGSVDNIRAATITNVANGVVNEIACDDQANVADEQVNNNEIVCGEGTELFGGECRAIPQRANPTVDVPNVPVPQVQQTETTIDLIATVTDTFENGVTTLDIKFNKNYVNYEIDVTQNGDRLFKETSHAMGTTVSYEIEGQGSTDNPIDVKITSLGIGLPGQEDKWTGPTGLITTVQVVPEFGTIAMMILVVAIVSVVAITSKSRLMTKI